MGDDGSDSDEDSEEIEDVRADQVDKLEDQSESDDELSECSGSMSDKVPTEEVVLLDEFLTTIHSLDGDGSWSRAYETGKPYREFAVSCGFFMSAWGVFARGRWVESALRWLPKHPGKPTPGNLENKYPDIRDSWKGV